MTADLARRAPNALTHGRRSTPDEVVLRMLVVKRLSGWSDAETERFVADSPVLRQVCRLDPEPVPDDTTLLRWANLIGPQTLAAPNDRVVELARALKVTRGRKLRVDGTVVEANTHRPTDSRLRGDGGRVLSRLLRRAKAVRGERTGLRPAPLRSRTRSVRRLAQRIHRVARRKGEAASRDLERAYADLVAVAKASRAQARRVATALQDGADDRAPRLGASFAQSLPLVDHAIAQATRRVLRGEAVPAAETLLSRFEPHTQAIRRPKAGKPVEFGRKVLLDEVEGGVVGRYEVLRDVGLEHPHLPASLDAHRQRFGRAPDLLAGDRGLSSPTNEALARAAGVERVVLPRAGRVPGERQRHERQRRFRRGARVRAGCPLGDRGPQQRAAPRRRAGPLPRSRGGRAGAVGRLGRRDPQPRQDRAALPRIW